MIKKLILKSELYKLGATRFIFGRQLSRVSVDSQINILAAASSSFERDRLSFWQNCFSSQAAENPSTQDRSYWRWRLQRPRSWRVGRPTARTGPSRSRSWCCSSTSSTRENWNPSWMRRTRLGGRRRRRCCCRCRRLTRCRRFELKFERIIFKSFKRGWWV